MLACVAHTKTKTTTTTTKAIRLPVSFIIELFKSCYSRLLISSERKSPLSIYLCISLSLSFLILLSASHLNFHFIPLD